MTDEQQKELEVQLTCYMLEKHTQDECIGFIDGFKKALSLFAVVGRSEQFVCRDCEKPTKEYRDNLCEPCHKWHTDS